MNKFDNLNKEFILNNIYNFSSSLEGNALRLIYKDQPA
jgi:hypothetical protein